MPGIGDLMGEKLVTVKTPTKILTYLVRLVLTFTKVEE